MLHHPFKKRIKSLNRWHEQFVCETETAPNQWNSLKHELDKIADVEAQYFCRTHLASDLNPRMQLSPAFREIERYFEVLAAA